MQGENMNYTPGPWKLFAKHGTIEVQASDGLPVAAWPGFDDSRRTQKTHKANARLMAVSPELLTALEMAVSVIARNVDMSHPDDAKFMSDTRALIARAK